jgi:hypothetical protein
VVVVAWTAVVVGAGGGAAGAVVTGADLNVVDTLGRTVLEDRTVVAVT